MPLFKDYRLASQHPEIRDLASRCFWAGVRSHSVMIAYAPIRLPLYLIGVIADELSRWIDKTLKRDWPGHGYADEYDQLQLELWHAYTPHRGAPKKKEETARG